MTHYIHDENNNRIEGMSKEEIYALLAAAIQSGELPSVDEDTAFVTMFKSIVDGKTYKMGFCTQAQYNQLEAQGLLVADAYYIITDDTTYDDLLQALTDLQDQIDVLTEKVEQGTRLNITSASSAVDFSGWDSFNHTYNNGVLIDPIGLRYLNYSTKTNQVNILPTGTVNSIAEASVNYVSGDSGYINYELIPIDATKNYVEFQARNVSGAPIYTPYTNGTTLKATTFEIYIKDTFGGEFRQQFTIQFKI